MAVEFDSLVVVASILLPVRERLAPALDRSPALRSRWRLFEEDLASAFDAAREGRDAASMASLLDDLKEALSSRRAAIETAAAVFIHGEAFGSLMDAFALAVEATQILARAHALPKASAGGPT